MAEIQFDGLLHALATMMPYYMHKNVNGSTHLRQVLGRLPVVGDFVESSTAALGLPYQMTHGIS